MIKFAFIHEHYFSRLLSGISDAFKEAGLEHVCVCVLPWIKSEPKQKWPLH